MAQVKGGIGIGLGAALCRLPLTFRAICTLQRVGIPLNRMSGTCHRKPIAAGW